MGRYEKFQRKSARKHEIHPIWRGIGCILIVIVLLISYTITTAVIPLLIATGLVPLELLGHIHFLDWVYRTPVLRSIATFIYGFNNLGLGIVVFIVILLLLTGISSLIYVAILQFIGPARYSEIDAPPSKHRAKKYKR